MSIEQLLKHHVKSTTAFDETYSTLDGAAIAEIASVSGQSRRDVAIAALRLGIVPLRFLAHRGSVPQAELAQLLGATVAVCGVGGLGGHVVMLLARLGVGRLVLIDGDTFAETNLNRQVFCNLAALGRSKVDVTREGVEAITDLVEVVGHKAWIDDDNARTLLQGCDVVVDGFDNLKGRAVARRACFALGVPFVGSGVEGFGGWVGSFAPGSPDFIPTIWADGFLPPNPAPKPGAVVRGPCDPGVFPATPHIMAGFEVVEVYRLICGRSVPPSDLVAMNTLSWAFVPHRLS